MFFEIFHVYGLVALVATGLSDRGTHFYDALRGC
jgi:hypothetical protein